MKLSKPIESYSSVREMYDEFLKNHWTEIDIIHFMESLSDEEFSDFYQSTENISEDPHDDIRVRKLARKVLNENADYGKSFYKSDYKNKKSQLNTWDSKENKSMKTTFSSKYTDLINKQDWDSLLRRVDKFNKLDREKQRAIKYLCEIFTRNIAEVKSLTDVVLKIYADSKFIRSIQPILTEYNNTIKADDLLQLKSSLEDYLEDKLSGDRFVDLIVNSLNAYTPAEVTKIADTERKLHDAVRKYIDNGNSVNFSKAMAKADKVMKSFGRAPANGIEAALGEYYQFDRDDNGDFTRCFKDASGNEACVSYHPASNVFSVLVGREDYPALYFEIPDANKIDLEKSFQDIDDGSIIIRYK